MQRQSLEGPAFRPPPSHPAPEPPRSSEPATAVDDQAALPTAAEQILLQLEEGRRAERRRLAKTFGVALVVHLIALFLVIPESDDKVFDIGKPGKVFVMEPVRFEKPPAPKQETRKEVPKKKEKRIPIPDPTPDEPEPIEIEDDLTLPEPELETPSEGAPFGIPDAPTVGPSSPVGGRFDGEAFDVGVNGVLAPKRLDQLKPKYTEDARQARIQGVVLLQGVVDEEGKVRGLTVLKGLPLGLSESALETAVDFRFEPATLDGKPVAVNYIFAIHFGLQ